MHNKRLEKEIIDILEEWLMAKELHFKEVYRQGKYQEINEEFTVWLQRVERVILLLEKDHVLKEFFELREKKENPQSSIQLAYWSALHSIMGQIYRYLMTNTIRLESRPAVRSALVNEAFRRGVNCFKIANNNFKIGNENTPSLSYLFYYADLLYLYAVYLKNRLVVLSNKDHTAEVEKYFAEAYKMFKGCLNYPQPRLYVLAIQNKIVKLCKRSEAHWKKEILSYHYFLFSIDHLVTINVSVLPLFPQNILYDYKQKVEAQQPKPVMKGVDQKLRNFRKKQNEKNKSILFLTSIWGGLKSFVVKGFEICLAQCKRKPIEKAFSEDELAALFVQKAAGERSPSRSARARKAAKSTTAKPSGPRKQTRVNASSSQAPGRAPEPKDLDLFSVDERAELQRQFPDIADSTRAVLEELKEENAQREQIKAEENFAQSDVVRAAAAATPVLEEAARGSEEKKIESLQGNSPAAAAEAVLERRTLKFAYGLGKYQGWLNAMKYVAQQQTDQAAAPKAAAAAAVPQPAVAAVAAQPIYYFPR